MKMLGMQMGVGDDESNRAQCLWRHWVCGSNWKSQWLV